MRMWMLLLFLLSGCSALGTASPLFYVERSLIYPSRPAAQPSEPGDVFFHAADGVKLHGRYFTVSQPKAFILFCHGNAGNVDSWSFAAQQLSEEQQCNVLVFDYRGYGHSEGRPSEAGLLADARGARAWLAQQAGIREVDIVLYGRSLGGGVAVDLAASDGCRGLILNSTFTSLPAVAAQFVPWLLPGWNMTQRFDSLAKIKHYAGPLLQSHGDLDQLIPLEMAKQLHDAAPGRKRFITVQGAGHNDPASTEVLQATRQFLDELPPLSRGESERVEHWR